MSELDELRAQIVSLTQERDQERDTAAANIAALRDRCQRFHARARAAEARVEALSEALRRLHQRFGHREFCDCATCIDARAALACPPQQQPDAQSVTVHADFVETFLKGVGK